MSAVDDFAEIARRLREKQGLPKPKSVRNEPQQTVDNLPGYQGPDPGHSHQYQQAARGMLPCSLCDDEGWIGVRRKGMWKGYMCPVCGNPQRKASPL